MSAKEAARPRAFASAIVTSSPSCSACCRSRFTKRCGGHAPALDGNGWWADDARTFVATIFVPLFFTVFARRQKMGEQHDKHFVAHGAAEPEAGDE